MLFCLGLQEGVNMLIFCGGEQGHLSDPRVTQLFSGTTPSRWSWFKVAMCDGSEVSTEWCR
jgi:hypothetical protein